VEQADATNYFRDLYELGADRSMSLQAKAEWAITIGRDRLDVVLFAHKMTANR
jgi:two-component system OmpR family sensor kinase